MKSRREHRVPLAPPALALLKHPYREDGNPHLFVGARNEALGDAAMSATLRRLGCNDTVHGMRSAFSTWAHDQTAQMCLAHAVGSDVEKVYRRNDLFNKRRKLLEQWAAYCCSPPAMAGKPVVPWRLHDLRRTAASGMAALGVQLPVIEKILNHVSGSFGGIVGVYQRHEFAAEMTEALARWAVHVQGLVAEKPGNVVEIRRRGDG